MSKAKGVRKADDLMRKLVAVPKSEVEKPKRKKPGRDMANPLGWSREALQLAYKRGAHAYKTGATTNDCPYKLDDVRRRHWLRGYEKASETVLGTRVEVSLKRVDGVYLYVADGTAEDMIAEAERKCPGRIMAIDLDAIRARLAAIKAGCTSGDEYGSCGCPACNADLEIVDDVAALLEECERLRTDVSSVLSLMDGLAEQWGDEGVFRRCRDRLRDLVTP